MQVVKCFLQKDSNDDNIRLIYNKMAAHEANFKREWRLSQLLPKLQSIVDFHRKFPHQLDRKGLGFGTFKTVISSVDNLSRCITELLKSEDHLHFVHATNMAMQGSWTKFID